MRKQLQTMYYYRSRNIVSAVYHSVIMRFCNTVIKRWFTMLSSRLPLRCECSMISMSLSSFADLSYWVFSHRALFKERLAYQNCIQSFRRWDIIGARARVAPKNYENSFIASSWDWGISTHALQWISRRVIVGGVPVCLQHDKLSYVLHLPQSADNRSKFSYRKRIRKIVRT